MSAEEATETKPEAHITSIPRVLSAQDFLETLHQMIMKKHIDPAEIMLALDGNLGSPGSEMLSECFYTFVGALRPGRLIIFTNTKECREAGEAYFAANEGAFLDRGVVKSTELRTAMQGMRERRAAESTALKEPDATPTATVMPLKSRMPLSNQDITASTRKGPVLQPKTFFNVPEVASMRSDPNIRENETQPIASVARKDRRSLFFSCCCPCGRRDSPIGDSSKPAGRIVDVENIETPSVRTATNITPSARDGENSMTERQFTI